MYIYICILVCIGHAVVALKGFETTDELQRTFISEQAICPLVRAAGSFGVARGCGGSHLSVSHRPQNHAYLNVLLI